MKRIYLATAVFILVSCSNNKDKTTPAKTTDTTIIAIPTDSNTPVDTNDHNKGGPSTISLDSPIGPPHHLKDTAEKR